MPAQGRQRICRWVLYGREFEELLNPQLHRAGQPTLLVALQGLQQHG